MSWLAWVIDRADIEKKGLRDIDGFVGVGV